MTAVTDFGMFPPEINSGRMYFGAGAAPMLTAAVAWNTLAAEMRSAAASYSSVISGLTSQAWRGPASTAMATAAAPYAAWMNTTAAQAEQTAAQAQAAVSAYETAFAATVPPPLVAANRAQLASLVATNVLGQNTPAIAATEAQYGEMWSQDAAAMYGYAGNSAAATMLTPFSAPQQTTSPTALPGQAAAVTQAAGIAAGTQQTTLSQLTSAVPTALQSLASPVSSTSGLGMLDTLAGNGSGPLSQIFNDVFSSNGLGLNSTLWNTIFSSGFYMPSNSLGAFMGLLSGTSAAGGSALGDAAAGGLGPIALQLPGSLGGGLGNLGGLGSLGGVSAGLGRAASLGALSVPPSWTAVTPPVSPLASALGATPLTAPTETGLPGMPGMPLTGMAANGGGTAAPKYGFRPTVVVHPPFAG